MDTGIRNQSRHLACLQTVLAENGGAFEINICHHHATSAFRHADHFRDDSLSVFDIEENALHPRDNVVRCSGKLLM